MKTALAAILILFLTLGLAAQTTKQSAAARPPQPAAQPSDPSLNATLNELQRACQAANGDIGKLRIDKWKVDGSQKAQMQQVAESLQKNITRAVPGLISDLQATPGSVAKAFNLYHNLTVVYEYLDTLSQAAGTYGKKEEYDPLSNDVANLDQVRGKLSDYIDQSATAMESQLNQFKKPAPPKTTTSPAQTGPKKIIIDNGETTTSKTKKKKKPSPATTNPPQPTNPPQ